MEDANNAEFEIANNVAKETQSQLYKARTAYQQQADAMIEEVDNFTRQAKASLREGNWDLEHRDYHYDRVLGVQAAFKDLVGSCRLMWLCVAAVQLDEATDAHKKADAKAVEAQRG